MNRKIWTRVLRAAISALVTFGAFHRVYITTVRVGGQKIIGEIKEMQLREGQKSTLTVGLRTRSGNLAQYEQGSGSWESSNPAVVSVTPNPDNELEAEIVGLNGSNNESVLITFHADGDPDAEETRDVIATLDATCTQGEAVVAEITASEPVDVE